MCGIFGFVGNRKEVAKIVLEGLKTLEYRGYDSWGIAVASGPEKKIVVEKHVGKIGEAKVNLPSSNFGIGHTRWATHGGVTKQNAHPHLDCTGQLALVHNGIVENFQKLKKELKIKGHKFVSETDTEIIVHLIEEELRLKPLKDAVREAFLKLTGLNAIVVLADGQLVVAKTGTPLVLGFGKKEFFVSSDAAALLPHTRNVYFIEDGQLAQIGQDGIEVFTLSGKKVAIETQKLTWKTSEVDLGKYKYFIEKEVYEQPEIIAKIAINNSESKKFAELVKDAYGTFFVACGSASYAALCGTYLFSKVAKKHVNFSIGSEFNYLEGYIHKGTLVIPISQSGESIDVIEPVIRAKKKGAKIAAIVNVLGSTLYREADFNLLLPAGPEKAVVATKSLTAMIATLIQIAFTLVGKEESAKKLLLAAAKNVENILQGKELEKIKKLAKFLKDKEHVYIIGRGISYPSALEATLKLKEASYVHAEGFAGGELKHGVIALISKGTPCIVFAPKDETYEAIISNAAEVKARGGYIIGISPKNNEVFDFWITTADLAEATMLSQIVIAQLLAYFIAIGKGLDPDKPRNLAKSVTVR
ncbi:MAG: glutamine--fructose-6-phosphate aminotransferase [Candidatus Woykebacteria bacterium RBG_13_40_7b]|uniref:Glutamine--fructose-6-phosphate aminotransferase [isomerizing] n=1 Tax=Candidatus Woykebacteria bacterium RBG_13_40_7b TaxID=1802594 RepID=A0A1G1W790_9BACT|nr:MAG: glutamine--fructose-6-phosphate aminotransferase [Candidatus Woykebacteria bacterium RBG_13_40_7b]